MIKPSQKWLDEDYLIIDVHSAKLEDGRAALASELLQFLRRSNHRVVRGELISLSATERDEWCGPRSLITNDLGGGGWRPRWSTTNRRPPLQSSIFWNMPTPNYSNFAITTKC